MTEDEIEEAVARAICREACGLTDEEVIDDNWSSWTAEARAAIKALRAAGLMGVEL